MFSRRSLSSSRAMPSKKPTSCPMSSAMGWATLRISLHAGGRVDGADLVELLDQAVLDRLADAVLRARERLRLVGGAVHGAVPWCARTPPRGSRRRAGSRAGAPCSACPSRRPCGRRARRSCRRRAAPAARGRCRRRRARCARARRSAARCARGARGRRGRRRSTRAPVTAEPARPDAVGEPAGERREDHARRPAGWRSRARP